MNNKEACFFTSHTKNLTHQNIFAQKLREKEGREREREETRGEQLLIAVLSHPSPSPPPLVNSLFPDQNSSNWIHNGQIDSRREV